MSVALIPVNVPDGLGVGCLQTALGTRYAEMVNGKLIIRMGWIEFRDLITSTNNGHLWSELNLDLVRQLSAFSL